MNNSLVIRSADLKDAEVIAEFNTRLAAETEGKSLVAETITAGVKMILSDPRHGRYFVACFESRIVGQLMHTREWSDWRNGEIWWLQSVYIHPDFRRRGIFRSLYQFILNQAEQTHGVAGIRLYVERQNNRAVEAYRSLGMDDAGYTVMERIFGNPIIT